MWMKNLMAMSLLSFRVRRKDTTVEITTLMEEHIRQKTMDFPNFLEEFICLPNSFKFDDDTPPYPGISIPYEADNPTRV